MTPQHCYILGISAFFHDSSVSLLADGELIFAAQEERYTRIKSDPSFPENALRDCLARQKISISDIDYLIFYEDPYKKNQRIIENCLRNVPFSFGSFKRGIARWAKEKINVEAAIKEKIISALFLNPLTELPPIFCTEHHLSHAASAFYPSPYDRAAILCIDGVGEQDTLSIWLGEGNQITKQSEIKYPHSLGLLYSAFTKYTGFKVNSGEYKLMGLAPYGKPTYKNLIMDNLLNISEDGSFTLNMHYFTFENGRSMIGRQFEKLFGKKSRRPESEITQHEMDVASSIQAVLNEIVLKLANSIHRKFNTDNLCMAGGVALNCIANSFIAKHSKFKNIWIQPAAGDAGGSLGAAYLMWYSYLKKSRQTSPDVDSMKGAYLGPDFSNIEIESYLSASEAVYEKIEDQELLLRTARLIAKGNVIGWHQGRMEFGPRSLGNRAILGDPRSKKMQSLMNLKIKYRESFRPFAPSVLSEYAKEYFSLPFDSPYMLFIAEVNPAYRIESTSQDKIKKGLDLLSLARSTIPAVTHVDFSARIQTIHHQSNPLYHSLVSKFFELTGCPLVINTSFNVRGEPIVCTPEDAYSCFMNTEMDYCVIGNYLLSKYEQPQKNRRVKKFQLD